MVGSYVILKKGEQQMARRPATFNVEINSMSGQRTVSVAVGTTVAQFKRDNDITATTKVFDEAGELSSTSILTSSSVTLITPKKNG
jgi:hypothetical protein